MGRTGLFRGFSETLVEWLQTDEAYALLPSSSTWTAGGCWILGSALEAWMDRPYTRQMALVSGGIPQHVVLEFRKDVFVDGDGVSTRVRLRKRWRELEGLEIERIVPFDLYMVRVGRQHGLSCPATRVQRVTQELRKVLGDPSYWGL